MRKFNNVIYNFRIYVIYMYAFTSIIALYVYIEINNFELATHNKHNEKKR